MSDEFAHLSDLELLSFIKSSEKELEFCNEPHKDKLKEEIEERLRTANLEFGGLLPLGGAQPEG